MRWLATLCCALALVGCSGGDDGAGGDTGATTSTSPPTTGAPPTEYSEQVETDFVDTCAAGAGEDLTDVCRCIYDRFEAEIPFDDFRAFDESLSADPNAALPPEFVDLYTDCVLESGEG